jgi:AraC-like DNA-binding protein
VADPSKYVASGTASAIVLRPLLHFAALRGLDVAAFLAELEVPAAAVDDQDYRISEATHERAWREAALRVSDPALGLDVAQHAPVGAFEALEYALRFSATLDEAFHRMAQFYRLLCDGLATSVEVRDGVARVRRTIAPHDRHSAECFFAFLALRARELSGPDLTLREVRFVHAAPPDVTPHAALFRCPVTFRSGAAELLFDARDFDRKVRVVTPGLADVLDRHMRDLVAQLPPGGALLDRVHHAVATTLQEQRRPSLETTARALKAAPRTVQRWLGEHGTTHREVVDAVRRRAAERLLELRALSITEIAFLLGFADVGGFERTFKRWTGKTPSGARGARASAP